MEVESIGNTQIIHMEETGMTQRTIGLLPESDIFWALFFEILILYSLIENFKAPETLTSHIRFSPMENL